MTAGYWIFIRTMTIFNPPSNWPPRPIVCMTIFIEWSRSDSDIPLLSPACRGWQAASVSRDYHGALCRSGPGQHQHITSHPEQRSRIRPEPVGAPWLPSLRSCPAHDCDHGFSDWWLAIFCSEAVDYVKFSLFHFWIIDWKDKRVDLFTHNIDVLGSCCYVLCNSEHWTYFQGTCIRLYLLEFCSFPTEHMMIITVLLLLFGIYCCVLV